MSVTDTTIIERLKVKGIDRDRLERVMSADDTTCKTCGGLKVIPQIDYDEQGYGEPREWDEPCRDCGEVDSDLLIARLNPDCLPDPEEKK